MSLPHVQQLSLKIVTLSSESLQRLFKSSPLGKLAPGREALVMQRQINRMFTSQTVKLRDSMFGLYYCSLLQHSFKQLLLGLAEHELYLRF